MARQVLPIVGAIVGAFYGNPQLGFAIGSIVGNAVDPQVLQGPKLGEAGLQTSAEGVFRPVVFGTGAVKGNIIDRGNRVVRKQRDRQGKGGGPVVESERVYWTFAIRLCEGPITGLLRIWQDEKLVYDVRPGSTILAESAEFAERFRLYYGDELQMPDPDLEVFRGAGNVSAYRGTAYVVFPNFDLTDFRERIPDFRFEVTTAGEVAVTGKWVLGPVAGDEESGVYYITADSPYDLPAATPIEVPASGNPLARITAANGVLFMLGVGTTGAVSFDKGATWQSITGVGGGQNVYWSGQHYYLSTGRSADGVTWSAVPNLTAPVDNFWARDGLVVGIDNTDLDPYLMVSHDHAATWDERPVVNGWEINPFMTDVLGNRILFTVDSVRARYTNDNFAHQPPIDSTPWPNRTFMAESVVFGRVGLDELYKSFDGGLNYQEDPALEVSHFGASANNYFAYGDNLVVAVEWFPTGPERVVLHISEDFGQTWAETAPIIGNGGYLVFLDAAAASEPQPVTLGSIVAALHARAGQDSTLFSVSELTDEVDGLVLAGDYTCADAIRTLMPIYRFDASEFDNGSGYRTHYVKRGKPVVLTLTEDDLLELPQKSTREDALERPRVLHLHFESPEVGYVPAKATVRRDSADVMVVGERSVQVPVVFSDVDEPAQIADMIMKIAWTEVAGEEEFVIHDGLLELVPSDCIGISLRGLVRRMRIIQSQIGPGEIRLRMIADRQSAYGSNAIGVPLPPPTPPPPSIVGPSVFERLDIPALNDGNDSLLWYEAVTGQTEAWFGAQTQYRLPSDSDYQNALRFTQNTIMGDVVSAPVPAASAHYTDTTNVVRVQLFTDDELESLTQAQFLSEGGSFALKNADGTWEVMQYRDAVDEGNRVWALSYLARGRLNTGGHPHEVGARFVLLDGVQSFPTMTGWRGQDISGRAVSLGTSPETATVMSDVYQGRSQIEFPVAHVLLDRAGDTINVRAVPRHRFGTEVNPIPSVNWSGYRMTATDGTNTVTVDTTSTTQDFDVTGWASPVTVTVSQLNRLTGAGPTVSEQIA